MIGGKKFGVAKYASTKASTLLESMKAITSKPKTTNHHRKVFK
jgi:hypothetical protein